MGTMEDSDGMDALPDLTAGVEVTADGMVRGDATDLFFFCILPPNAPNFLPPTPSRDTAKTPHSFFNFPPPSFFAGFPCLTLSPPSFRPSPTPRSVT